MKMFELSSKENKNGRRKFKAVLYTIYPDSCVDEANQIGTLYNQNGITWIREYCENALSSIIGMSLRCEFIDDERTEILGHGDTGIIDGEPVYENAVVIGMFTNGYIDDIDIDGTTITACIGEGEIDAQCYHNFVSKLESDIADGIYPSGSIEIMRCPGNNEIIYKYGYKDKGRIPMEFIHSGYALLGVEPADSSAMLIELNKKHKEDLAKMDELEIKTLISQVVNELSSCTSEINACKEDCEAKIKEAEQKVEEITAEKNQVVATSEELQTALDEVKKEFAELNEKYNVLWEEKRVLEESLAEANARERVNELSNAVSEFSAEEQAYAEKEIEAFKKNPIESEINSVISKIWEGIGKASKKEQIVAEQNSAKDEQVDIEDIFGEVVNSAQDNEDVSIF